MKVKRNYGWFLAFLMLLPLSVYGNDKDQSNLSAGNQAKTRIEKLKSVDLRDGVDQREATILADQYFFWKVSGCGGIDAVEDMGKAWKFQSRIGYEGRNGPILIIDKSNGDIIFEGKKSHFPLKDLLHLDQGETTDETPANVR